MGDEERADLIRRVKRLAVKKKPDFLKLATGLSDLDEHGRHALAELWKNGEPLKRRRALYLRDIGRTLSTLKMDPKVFTDIGWTKIAAMSGKLAELQSSHSGENLHQRTAELCDFARNHSVRQLRARLVEQAPVAKQRCVLLYFNEADYQTYEAAVAEHGAKKKGGKSKALVGQEQALLKVIAGTAQPSTEQ